MKRRLGSKGVPIPALTAAVRSARYDHSRGYTLVELMIVVAIVVTVAAIGIPSYREMVNTAQVVAAMGDIRQMSIEISLFQLRSGRLPESLMDVRLHDRLDPWARPYQYLCILGKEVKGGGVRKDKNLHPLNSDYDLYSLGRDGGSSPPLTAKQSRDDVIRANNGGYIGLARNY